MRFDLITIFPRFFDTPLEYGVVPRARTAGLLQIEAHDLRAFTHDLHRTTDDRPFGGGEGMVMKLGPIYECLLALTGEPTRGQRQKSGLSQRLRVCLMSAQGPVFQQRDARRLGSYERVILICGRYEGVDERVVDYLVDEELSIGDFILSGGELPACVVMDSVARLLPGVLGHELSAENESFSAYSGTDNTGILDCPHYTRPVDFQGWTVPEVLRGGNHAEIGRWRRKQALRKTLRHRPDLLHDLKLAKTDQKLLRELEAEAEEGSSAVTSERPSEGA